MPEYRHVLIKYPLYEQLRKRQLPDEELSQTIERLLNRVDEIYGHARAIYEVVRGEEKQKAGF